MRGLLDAGIFEQFGARTYFERLLEGLREQPVVCGLFPKTYEINRVWSCFSRHCENSRRECRIIPLGRLAAEILPASSLADFLHVKWPSPHTPHSATNLCKLLNLPPGTVLGLRDFEKLNDLQRTVWLEFLAEWVVTAKTAIGLPGFCLLTHGRHLSADQIKNQFLPEPHYWWGIVSELEVRLVVRRQENERSRKAEWREHLIPSLAADDSNLAATLWDAIVEMPVTQLPELFRNEGGYRGWTERRLRELGVTEALIRMSGHTTQFPEIPIPTMPSLWAEGMLQWTPERGTEVHVVALALLNRDQDILHRIWRAQAELILPMIATARLQVCQRLTEMFGQNWPRQWAGEYEEHEIAAGDITPYSCGLGRLKRTLQRCPASGTIGRRLCGGWLPLITHCHRLRNSLAHNQAINFEDYRDFSELMYKANLSESKTAAA